MVNLFNFIFLAFFLSAPAARCSVINLHSRQEISSLNQQRADAVKEAFKFAWDGYYQYAFPNDELRPVSNGFSNTRNSWGATAIDAFSTALVMEIPEVVDQILEYIPTINFDRTDTEVSVFETTIRYLAGLLSGFDLLKGPLSHLASNETAVDLILAQAIRLADNLAYAFDTPSGVPHGRLLFSNKSVVASTDNGLADAGTLVFEWTHLSDLTNNQTYAELSQKCESHLLDPKPATSEPWPGLLGSSISLETGEFLNSAGGWVGGADSFYEYLIKMYAYDTTRFATYRDRWILAADSSIAHLASHPSTRPDFTFMAAYDGQNLRYVSQHLACFDGGNFIFGGLILDEQKYVDFGLELVNGCHETYQQTLTGIGPEIFRWVTSDNPSNDPENPPPPADQAVFYAKAGFYPTAPSYALRPEVIESFYYAYRATRDPKYQEWAWNAFVAINATCRVGSGFAPINNVNEPTGGGHDDFQESFFFAEVLKYSYLIQAPESEWQVEHDGSNSWVFNTEAHPFRIAGSAI